MREGGGWRTCMAIVCLAVCTRVAATSASACETDGRYIMGTVFQATLCQDETDETTGTLERQQSMQNVFADVFATAQRFDALFTTYSSESPLSHINAHGGRGLQQVPAEVIDILRMSQRYSDLTQGAFDVTVGPLLTLWRQSVTAQEQPTAAAIVTTLLSMGSHKIQFGVNHQVSLPSHTMALDLGGIGKGYALDQAVKHLQEQGVTNALLSFGQSSLWALGQPPGESGWRLLLRRPNGEAIGIATFGNQAISVSGSLGDSMEVGGQRYGHIIDPRTGMPVQRDLLACIVAPSAAQAEALSTALLVLGESEGLTLIERLDGVEGILLEANGRRWMTTGWQQTSHFVSF